MVIQCKFPKSKSVFCSRQGAKYALMCGVQGLTDLEAPIPKCAPQEVEGLNPKP